VKAGNRPPPSLKTTAAVQAAMAAAAGDKANLTMNLVRELLAEIRRLRNNRQLNDLLGRRQMLPICWRCCSGGHLPRSDPQSERKQLNLDDPQ